MAETPETNKPVLRNGYPIRDLGDGSIISGQANGEELVLGAEAMNPLPLAHFAPITVARSQKGLIVGDTVRCPWHHVCFSLRNGEALRAPILDPVP